MYIMYMFVLRLEKGKPFSVHELIITPVSFNKDYACPHVTHVVRFFRNAVMGECKHSGTYISRNQETICEFAHT